MRHRHGNLLAGYWSGLSVARLITAEADCDEAIIGSLAPHILILETDDRNRLRYTVAGSAVEHALGVKLRDTGFLDHWDPRDRQMLQDYCQRALDSHRPLCLMSFCGAHGFAFETVLVPVTMAGTAKKRFIGISTALTDAPAAIPLRRVQHLTHIGFVRDELVAVRGDAREM
jgi:hypothetical protein